MNANITCEYSNYHPSCFKDVRENMVFVDVGAWQGDTVISTLKQHPLLRVIAIEPYPEHFKKLQETTKSFRNVCLSNKACWNKGEKKYLYPTHDHGKNAGCSLLKRQDSNEGRKTLVEADTLDSILSTFKIDNVDLLKIDTEGAEKQILAGFTKYRKGTQFNIESHSNLGGVLRELYHKGVEHVEISLANPEPGGDIRSFVIGRF